MRVSHVLVIVLITVVALGGVSGLAAADHTTYNLTVVTQDIDSDAANTTYEIKDTSDGTVVESGLTGTDGQVNTTLQHQVSEYQVIVGGDEQFEQTDRLITLDSDKQVSIILSRKSYNLSIDVSSAVDDTVSTDYTVYESDTVEVQDGQIVNGDVAASGTTGSDGQATEELPSGSYTVEYGSSDGRYYTSNQTVSLTSNQSTATTVEPVELSVSVNDSRIFVGESVTFDANLSDRSDDQYAYDWYVNNDTVRTDHADTFDYTFDSSGNYTIEVTTTIDGFEYRAVYDFPESGWTDNSDGSVSTDVLDLTVQTEYESNGTPVVANHRVWAKFPNSETLWNPPSITKVGETTDWQVVNPNAYYGGEDGILVAVNKEGYGVKFRQVSISEGTTQKTVTLTLPGQEVGDDGKVKVESLGRAFNIDDGRIQFEGLTVTQGGVIRADDGDDVTTVPDIFPTDSISSLLTITVIGASSLVLIGVFGLLALLAFFTGGETIGGVEDNLLDSVSDLPNPLRWFRDD
jgi:hypothetical protein